MTKSFRAKGGAYGMIIPYLPSKDDLFLIISIDGMIGTLGGLVNRVNFVINSFIVGNYGALGTLFFPISELLFFITSIDGVGGIIYFTFWLILAIK